MDALGSLEEIAERASFRIDVGSRQRHTKTKATHKKKRREPKPPCQAPSPAAVPVRAKLGRAFSDYRTLVEICRARADELDLSRAELDRISGLCPGYAAKILSLGKGKNPKRMGMISLEIVLNTLGLKIVLIEDEAATARTLRQRVPVDRSQQRFGNVSRIGGAPAAPRHLELRG